MRGPAFFFVVHFFFSRIFGWGVGDVSTYLCMCKPVCVCVFTFCMGSSLRTGCVLCVTCRKGSTLLSVHHYAKDVDTRWF